MVNKKETQAQEMLRLFKESKKELDTAIKRLEGNTDVLDAFFEKNVVLTKTHTLQIKKTLTSANEVLDRAEIKKLEKVLNQSEYYETELYCPKCGEQHIDSGEWKKRLHHKHLCLHCNSVWELEDYVFGTKA